VDALPDALAKVAGRKFGEELRRANGQLRGHGHEHESRFGEPTMTRILFALLVLGVFATYASTLGTLGTMYISSDGTFRWEYGFPLPWQTVVGISCNSPLRPIETHDAIVNAPCLKSYSTSYNWGFFTIDVLFYVVVGSGLHLAFRKFRPSPSLSPA